MPTETFNSSGQYSFSLPENAISVTFTLTGGTGAPGYFSGEDGSSSGGGNASRIEVTADASDLPTTDFDIYVGGNGERHYSGSGSGGFNGGGKSQDWDEEANGGPGGGASDIRPSGGDLSDRLAVAAGGGGGGAAWIDSFYHEPAETTAGADGGLPFGEGANSNSEAKGGGGGTETSGGSGGQYGGQNGSFGEGGDAGVYNSSEYAGAGGGGGGGYYGGGGGGEDTINGGPIQGAGGGGGSSYYDSDLFTLDSSEITGSGEVVEISYTVPPSSPNNVDSTYIADDQIDFSWDVDTSGGTPNSFDVEIERDGSGFQVPTGGPSSVSHDGSASYAKSYGPDSDSSYGSQVGIDSSFRFRVRAVNSGGTSGWTYSDTVYTTPIPPHNPSVSRPDANTVRIEYRATSDAIEQNGGYSIVEFREDTGSAYGAWDRIAAPGSGNSANSLISGHPSNPGDNVVIEFQTGTEYGYGNSFSEDSRVQFRIEHELDGYGDYRSSENVYADYGNEGNVYFEDDFESGDYSAWDSTGTTIYTGDGNGNYGLNDADSGTYWAVVDIVPDDSLRKDLGDLSGESDVVVRASVAPVSVNGSESGSIEWYDGSSWQTLENFGWEYNNQGWTQVVSLVPDSWLSTDNRVRFGSDSSGAYYGLDSVVVSDILHEYTEPATPSNLSVTASTQGELDLSWTDNASFEDSYIKRRRETGTSTWEAHEGVTGENGTSHTETDLNDGESYDFQIYSRVYQYRNGVKGPSNYYQNYSSVSSETTILPAPSSVNPSPSSDKALDVSWIDDANNEDGHDVYYRESGTSTWNKFSNLGADVQSEVIGSLSQDTTYEVRIDNYTEHTTSQSSIASATTFLNEGRTTSTYSSSGSSSVLRVIDLLANTSSYGTASSENIRVIDLIEGVVSSSNAISAATARTGINLLREANVSHSNSSNSSVQTSINLLALPTSGAVSSSSSSDRLINFDLRSSSSHSPSIYSESIRIIDVSESTDSYSESVRSFVYNERTSLEVVDQKIIWDDDSSVWYTDWFQESKILGTEDDLAIRSLVVPEAKEPAARVKVQYDSNGNGEVDTESDHIELGSSQDVHDVPGVPVDESGYYRIKIMEYSGYNSIYSLGMAIIH